MQSERSYSENKPEGSKEWRVGEREGQEENCRREREKEGRRERRRDGGRERERWGEESLR